VKANEKYSEFAWHIGITSSAVSSCLNAYSMSIVVTNHITAVAPCLRIAPFGRA
jgi:hypothetical protein